MSESLLHDLYFGEIRPWERQHKYTREYRELTKKIIGIDEHFKNLLLPEDYKKFEEMRNLRAQADMIESTELFKYAFRTGALMMIDIFRYEEND